MRKTYILLLEALVLSGFILLKVPNPATSLVNSIDPLLPISTWLLNVIGIVLVFLLGFFNKHLVDKERWAGFFQGIFILFKLALLASIMTFVLSVFTDLQLAGALATNAAVGYFLFCMTMLGLLAMTFILMLIPHSLGLAIGLYLKTKKQQNLPGSQSLVG